MLNNISIEKVYQYLLIMLAFLMPLTVAGANTIIVIIVVLWLFSGNYNLKYSYVRKNKCTTNNQDASIPQKHW